MNGGQTPAGVLAVLILATCHLAQATDVPPRPQLSVSKIEALPAWDGILTDPCWKAVPAQHLQPPLNAPDSAPLESTDVRMRWCDDYLLVRFDCRDTAILPLPASEGKEGERDLRYFLGDAVEVFLDPVGDGRMYMEFQVSPHNGVFDAIYFCASPVESQPNLLLTDAIVNRDLFWIKEWNLEGLRTAACIWPTSEGAGWSAVLAFPAGPILHRLGQKKFGVGTSLKMNLVRFDYSPGQRSPQISNWARVMGGCAHISPAGMGTLTLSGPASPAHELP